MSINFNSQYTEKTIQSAVQKACAGDQNTAMGLLKQLGLTHAQQRRIATLFRNLTPFSNQPVMAKRVISILTNGNFFFQFPLHVQKKIPSSLNMKDILSFSSTCRSLNRAIKDDIFFEEIFSRDFPAQSPKPTREFFCAYKEGYIERKSFEGNFQNGICTKRSLETPDKTSTPLGTRFYKFIAADETLYSTSMLPKNEIIVWDAEVTKRLKTISMHKNSNSSALILVDGKFYSGCTTGDIEVWDSKTGNFLGNFEGHGSCVMALAYGDGVFYSGSSDKTIKMWNLETKTCKTLEGHEGEVCILAYGEGLLCSGSRDNTIKIWDLEGNCTHTLEGHSDSIQDLIFRDGVLYSASYDGTVKVWNPTTGECLRTIITGQEHVYSLSFFNESLCLSGENVEIWDPKTGKPLYTILVPQYNRMLSITAFKGKLCGHFGMGGIGIWDFTKRDIVVFNEHDAVITQEIKNYVSHRTGRRNTLDEESYDDVLLENAVKKKFPKLSAETKNRFYELCGIPVSEGDPEEEWIGMSLEKKHVELQKYSALKEMPTLLRSGDDKTVQKAMSQFSEISEIVQAKIYELCGVKSSQEWESISVEQKADSIEQYFK